MGDRQVRIVPDVSVSGNDGAAGLVGALLGTIAREKTGG